MGWGDNNLLLRGRGRKYSLWNSLGLCYNSLNGGSLCHMNKLTMLCVTGLNMNY